MITRQYIKKEQIALAIVFKRLARRAGDYKAETYMTKLKDVMDGIVKDINIIDESNVTIVNSINQLSASLMPIPVSLTGKWILQVV